MIYEVAGDILFSKAQAIAHGIAPNDSFDQGLARALRERWPIMHKDYRHYTHLKHPQPGEIWEWGGFGVRIFNLMTQMGGFEHGEKPGRATLSNVEHCLKTLHQKLIDEKITSVALPRLATGVGGLEWDDVRPLIHKHLGNLQIPVILYATYHPGERPDETGL